MTLQCGGWILNLSENYYCHFQGHRFLQSVVTQLPVRVVPQPRRLEDRNDNFIDLFSGTLNFIFFNIQVVKFPSSRTEALFKKTLIDLKKLLRISYSYIHFLAEYLNYNTHAYKTHTDPPSA